jgi:hypothetical protein
MKSEWRVQVHRKLLVACTQEDLLSIAPLERKPALQEQLDLLQSGARDAITEESDRIYASRGDPGGLG